MCLLFIMDSNVPSYFNYTSGVRDLKLLKRYEQLVIVFIYNINTLTGNNERNWTENEEMNPPEFVVQDEKDTFTSYFKKI
jgi:hypothetical protein